MGRRLRPARRSLGVTGDRRRRLAAGRTARGSPQGRRVRPRLPRRGRASHLRADRSAAARRHVHGVPEAATRTSSRFRDRLQADALEYGETPTGEPPLQRAAYELMAAKVVGRWRDGKRHRVVPSADRARIALGDAGAARPEQRLPVLARSRTAAVCPLGAHIRRTEPPRRPRVGGRRPDVDATASSDAACRTGPSALRRGREGRRGDRGLIFICFNADIERQFEVVQRAVVQRRQRYSGSATRRTTSWATTCSTR